MVSSIPFKTNGRTDGWTNKQTILTKWQQYNRCNEQQQTKENKLTDKSKKERKSAFDFISILVAKNNIKYCFQKPD